MIKTSALVVLGEGDVRIASWHNPEENASYIAFSSPRDNGTYPEPDDITVKILDASCVDLLIDHLKDMKEKITHAQKTEKEKC